MKIKKIVKIIGKCFVALKQENAEVIGQSILVVDNGYSLPEQVSSAIEKVKNYFPKSEISVLTFEQRKPNLQKGSPNLRFILLSQRSRPGKYQIALQMLKMRKAKYDSVVLLSLDITPLAVALICLKAKVFLYNQWGQWWFLKLRTINELFKVTYVKKKAVFSFKDILKRIGLFFVLPQQRNEEALRHSILVADNGYAASEQIRCLIQRMKEYLPQAKISVLTLGQSRELKDSFPSLEIIKASYYIIERYRIARHMLKLRKNRYDYVILLSLDVVPIIVSILLMDTKILLYNQWHQWWSLNPKSIKSYLIVIPQFIYNIIVFFYLLISLSWLFLNRLFNVFRLDLLRAKERD